MMTSVLHKLTSRLIVVSLGIERLVETYILNLKPVQFFLSLYSFFENAYLEILRPIQFGGIPKMGVDSFAFPPSATSIVSLFEGVDGLTDIVLPIQLVSD